MVTLFVVSSLYPSFVYWFHPSGEDYTSPKPLFKGGFCAFYTINVYS